MNNDFWNIYVERPYMTTQMLDVKKHYFNTLLSKFDYKKDSAIEIGAGQGIYTEVFIDMFQNYLATEPNKMLFNMLSILLCSKYKNKKRLVNNL